jgi:hypothetical protein
MADIHLSLSQLQSLYLFLLDPGPILPPELTALPATLLQQLPGTLGPLTPSPSPERFRQVSSLLSSFFLRN